MNTTSSTYIGTKIIGATPMNRLAYNVYRGWDLPANENGADEGYLVEYQDGGTPNHPAHAGYISWSPKEQFEKAYRQTPGLTFGLAMEAVKLGKRVARIGWNGKGMFVYMVPPASYPVQTGAAKEHFGDGSMVPYNAYLAIKTTADTVSTWAPSVNDALADDWVIVEGRPKYLPHQQRVVDEKAELDERLGKLHAFLKTGVFKSLPDEDQILMDRQARAMRMLSGILGERIARF